MSTFDVRTLPRELVVTDLEEPYSATELERFCVRSIPLRELILLAMPSEISSAPSPSSSLSLTLQTLPYLRSLSLSSSTPHTPQSFLPSSSPLLCPPWSTPVLFPLSLPLLLSSLKPLASLLPAFLQRALFHPFLVANLPLVVVFLATVSATVTVDIPVPPPPRWRKITHVVAFSKAQ